MRVTSALQTLAPEVREHRITRSNQSTKTQVHCPCRCFTGHGVEDVEDVMADSVSSSDTVLIHCDSLVIYLDVSESVRGGGQCSMCIDIGCCGKCHTIPVDTRLPY